MAVPTDRAQFARIPAAAVRALMAGNESANVEVYLPPNADEKGPVLYRRAGAAISLPDLERMKQHGVLHLYVRAEDLRTCERELESRLDAILQSPHVEPADKADIVQTAATAVARDLVQVSVTREGLERTTRVVDGMIGCVLTDPVVASHLLKMAAHERNTASHMFMVSTLGVLLGVEVFGQHPETLRSIGFAGMLHDMGKLAIPSAILKKQGPLTRDELTLIQQHPIESVRLVADDPHVTPEVREIILQHHERIDGRGYPVGLMGCDLHLGSKLLAIVDSYHAMIGRRPYRAAMTTEDANRIMMMQANRQFDGEMLRLWASVCERCAVPTDAVSSIAAVSSGEEFSSRHEHRPVSASPRPSSHRRPRYGCRGTSVVECVHAGRLLEATVEPPSFGALLHDISRGGLCMFSDYPMYRGEVVHLRLKGEQEGTWLRGVVSWCRRQEANVFRIGVQFLERIPEEQSRTPVPVLHMGEAAATHEAAPAAPNTGIPAPAAEGTSAAPTAEVGDRTAQALRALSAIAALKRVAPEAERTAVTLAMTGELTVRLKAVDVLAGIKTRAAREALVILLRDANPEVRERTVGALGAMRATEAVKALQQALRDPVRKIALRAAGALGRMGDNSGLRLALSVLDTDEPEARLAAQVVGDIVGHKFAANREGILAARRYVEAKGILAAAS